MGQQRLAQKEPQTFFNYIYDIGPTLHANLEEGTSFYLIHHQNRYYNNMLIPSVEEIKIPEIHYHSIDHLVETINQSCHRRGRAVKLLVDNDRVSVVVEEENCGIFFKTYLARILGFADATFIFSTFTLIQNIKCFNTTFTSENDHQGIEDSSSLPPPPPPFKIPGSDGTVYIHDTGDLIEDGGNALVPDPVNNDDYEEQDSNVANQILSSQQQQDSTIVNDFDNEEEPPVPDPFEIPGTDGTVYIPDTGDLIEDGGNALGT